MFPRGGSNLELLVETVEAHAVQEGFIGGLVSMDESYEKRQAQGQTPQSRT
jgi:hypothetical protein